MIELLLAAEGMLAGGDLDHAERLFSQVAEADPRNAIAVVGLAEVAAARGDEAGALEAARRALEIDPENAAARRMIDRLEPVARRPDATSAPELEAAPEAPPVLTRRSWLDRLIRFLRRR
jgi:thioredoxin-like negative regulator of GroEL